MKPPQTALDFVRSRPRARSRFTPHLDMLEARELLTSYVDIDITNDTQVNAPNTGLPSSQIYVFFTQENVNRTWTIDPSTGIATPNAPGVLAPTITLAQLAAAGGAIKVDSSLTVDSARIYLSNSPNAVTLSGGNVSGPTAGTAPFIYDFVEFALNSQPGILNIDTTQVDQLGIPMTLQVTPNDPNFPAGSGIISTLDRQTLISDFQAMATGPLAAFADCVITVPGPSSTVLRLLNPSDVISSQLNATNLSGTITTSGSPGNWAATFTITGPGSPPPTNGGLAAGMKVSGPLMPAGAVISSLPGFPSGNTVVMTSSQTNNPFTPTSTAEQLFFYNPPTTALSTYFDQSLDNFFTYYKDHPNTLVVEENNGAKNVVYTGNVVQLPGIADINGGTSTYTVLQFTGNGETYNVYYPFFTTNSPAGKQTPFDTPVPPPPAWWTPSQGLKFFEPPSEMVFGADGAFADNVQQNNSAPNHPISTVQGAIENVLVTALARGYATSWQFRNGTIVQVPPVDGQFAKTATVSLTTGDTTNLNSNMYMASYQIANVPMTPNIPAGSPVTQFSVTSPLPIPPTTPDLLTFANFYPADGVWSAFASFLHNDAGYDITIDGRAYALPFDDQGGFSSDLNSATSVANPASVSIVLSPWAPQPGSAKMVGNDLLVTGTNRGDAIAVQPTSTGKVRVLLNGRSLGVFAPTERIIVNGLNGNDFISGARIRDPLTIYGDAGNDSLIGGLGDDVLVGGPGNDILYGGRGDDVLIGGPGKNVLNGGRGDNQYIRGAGKDRIIKVATRLEPRAERALERPKPVHDRTRQSALRERSHTPSKSDLAMLRRQDRE